MEGLVVLLGSALVGCDKNMEGLMVICGLTIYASIGCFLHGIFFGDSNNTGDWFMIIIFGWPFFVLVGVPCLTVFGFGKLGEKIGNFIKKKIKGE